MLTGLGIIYSKSLTGATWNCNHSVPTAL